MPRVLLVVSVPDEDVDGDTITESAWSELIGSLPLGWTLEDDAQLDQ